jgi:hypothetical protein
MLLSGLCFLLGGTSNDGPDTTPKKFRVFDSMLFTEKPNLGKLGFESILTTDREFFAGTYPNYDTTKGDEAATRRLARRLALEKRPLVIDIEHWPVDVRGTGEEVVEANIKKLTQIVDWVRAERPDVKVGFYGLPPLSDYWTPVGHLTAIEKGARNEKAEADFQAWQAANQRLKGLAEKVDFVCPSLYTFYDDPDGWKKYARANIEEARKYAKPVYPFLWMEYHDSNAKLKGQVLPADYWKMELETCRELADGVVIWGGFQRRWNPLTAWWKVTVQFMAEKDVPAKK